MLLNQLIKITTKSKKRVGRGVGSGKGKTAGRGTKGQKARGRISLGFVGGTLPLYKKLPYRRGIGNPKRSSKPTLVPLSRLAAFKVGAVVDLQSLIDAGIVGKKALRGGVKIVGKGDVGKRLIVKVPLSQAAAENVEKSGGKVNNV